MKEIKQLCTAPPDGIKLFVSEECIANIQAEIDGPVGTPFEGGLFRCKLVLGQDFPQAPPKAFFLTKIFHPNVSKSGEICVNTLKKDWKPAHGIGHVLMVIRCLLIVPNPESALNEDAGKLLLERYEDYAERARLMTSIHAKHPGAAAKGAGAKRAEESKAEESAAVDARPPSPGAAAPSVPAPSGGVLVSRSLSALPLSIVSADKDKLSGAAAADGSGGKAAPAMPSAPLAAQAQPPSASAPVLTRAVSAANPSLGVKKPAAPVKKAVKRL